MEMNPVDGDGKEVAWLVDLPVDSCTLYEWRVNHVGRAADYYS